MHIDKAAEEKPYITQHLPACYQQACVEAQTACHVMSACMCVLPAVCTKATDFDNKFRETQMSETDVTCRTELCVCCR